MQTEYEHGFLLETPEGYPEDRYQQVKSTIEETCKWAMHCCELYKTGDKDFAFNAEAEKFITIRVKGADALFGIYESASRRIVTEYDIRKIARYVDHSVFESLANRIESECKGVLKGRISERPEITAAWDAVFEEQRRNLTESLQYISRKYDCREDELFLREAEGHPAIVSVERGIVFAVLKNNREIEKEPNSKIFFDKMHDPETAHAELLRTASYKGTAYCIYDGNTGELEQEKQEEPEEKDTGDYGDV
jgi:hypothetical protein